MRRHYIKRGMVLTIILTMMCSLFSYSFADKDSEVIRSFAEFVEGSDTKIPVEDYNEMEKLFNKAISFSDEGKSEEASKKYEEFDKIAKKYFTYGTSFTDETMAQEEEYLNSLASETFEEYYAIVAAYFAAPMPYAEKEKLRNLYEQMKTAELARRFDEGAKLMDEMNELEDIYFNYSSDNSENRYLKYQTTELDSDKVTFAEYMKWKLKGTKVAIKDLDKILMNKYYNMHKKLRGAGRFYDAKNAWQSFYSILLKYVNDKKNSNSFYKYIDGHVQRFEIEIPKSEMEALKEFYDRYCTYYNQGDYDKACDIVDFEINSILNRLIRDQKERDEFYFYEEYMNIGYKDNGVIVDEDENELLKLIFNYSMELYKMDEFVESQEMFDVFFKKYDRYFVDIQSNKNQVAVYNQGYDAYVLDIMGEQLVAIDPLKNERMRILYTESKELESAGKVEQSKAKMQELDKMIFELIFSDNEPEYKALSDLFDLTYEEYLDFYFIGYELRLPSDKNEKLKNLYQKAMMLKSQERHDDYDNVMRVINSFLNCNSSLHHYLEFKNYNFEEYLEYNSFDKSNAPKSTLDRMKLLFNEAKKLNESQRHVEADLKLDLLNKYLMKEIDTYDAYMNAFFNGELIDIPDTDNKKMKGFYKASKISFDAKHINEGKTFWSKFVEIRNKYVPKLSIVDEEDFYSSYEEYKEFTYGDSSSFINPFDDVRMNDLHDREVLLKRSGIEETLSLWTLLYHIKESYSGLDEYDTYKKSTFEEFVEDNFFFNKVTLLSSDAVIMKSIFGEAKKYNEQGNHTEASIRWECLREMLNAYDLDYTYKDIDVINYDPNYSFNSDESLDSLEEGFKELASLFTDFDFIMSFYTEIMGAEIKDEDMNKLRELYEEGIELINQGKDDEAELVMLEFNKIMEKYVKDFEL